MSKIRLYIFLILLLTYCILTAATTAVSIDTDIANDTVNTDSMSLSIISNDTIEIIDTGTKTVESSDNTGLNPAVIDRSLKNYDSDTLAISTIDTAQVDIDTTPISVADTIAADITSDTDMNFDTGLLSDTVPLGDTTVSDTVVEDTKPGRIFGLEEKLPEDRIIPGIVFGEKTKFESKLFIKGRKTVDIKYGGAHFINEQNDKNKQASSGSLSQGLDIKQTLAVQIRGKVTPKITVDVDYNDQAEENKIALTKPQTISVRYNDPKGIIKEVAFATNLNLSIPGTQFLSFNKSVTGLRLKAEWKKLQFQSIFSITNAKSAYKEFKGNTQRKRTQISDLNYIKGRYYFLHNYKIKPGSEYIYIDNNDVTDNIEANTMIGKNQILSGTEYVADTYIGQFDVLYPGTDYTIDYTLSQITFKRSINNNDVIIVAYKTSDTSTEYGYKSNGSIDTENMLMIKNGIKHFYESKYEMKNIYSLGANEIMIDDFELTILDNSKSDSYNGIEYTKIFGLDRNNDGKVDKNDYKVLATGEYQVIDFYKGLITFYDSTPFNLLDGYDSVIDLSGLDSSTLSNTTVYEKSGRNSDYEIHVQYYTKLRSFNLGFGIMEESEKVTLDDKQLQRDQDYFIDYEVGRITFLNPDIIKPESNIRVDYEYIPFFGGGNEIIAGGRLTHQLSKNFNYGLGYIFNGASSVSDIPKVNEAPASQQVIDFNFNANVSEMLNDGYNYLSGTSDTDKKKLPFTLSVSGEVARGVRKPNTFGKALIDDMEGIKTRETITTYFENWQIGSKPGYKEFQDLNPDSTIGRITINQKDEFGYKEDVYDEIQRSMSIGYDFTKGNWVSMIASVDRQGRNYADMRYLRIWVYKPKKEQHLNLGIDLGILNEDADGDGILDSEDLNNDGILQEVDEDSGYVVSGPLYGDQYETYNVKGVLNSEDLNRDGRLLQGDEILNSFITELDTSTQGWIPVTYKLDINDNNKDKWENIKQCRIWIQKASDGQNDIDTIYIDEIEVLGNQWEEGSVNHTNDSFVVGSKNTEDNPGSYSETNENGYDSLMDDDKYSALFLDLHPQIKTDITSNEQIIESSLTINYSLSAKTGRGYTEKEFHNAQDFVDYEKIIFFYRRPGITKYPLVGEKLFFQFGTDKNNYFQYTVKLPAVLGQWVKVEIDLNKIARLQTDEIEMDDQYQKLGSPKLNNIKRIAFGVLNESDFPAQGEIWINEVYLDNVRNRIGDAMAFNASTSISNILSLSSNYSEKDADFTTIGSVEVAQSKSRSYGVSGSLNLFKCLPLSGGYSYSENEVDERQIENILLLSYGANNSRSYNFSTSFNPSVFENWFLKRLPAISGGYSRGKTETNNRLSNQLTDDESYNLSTSYGISFPNKIWIIPIGNLSVSPSASFSHKKYKTLYPRGNKEDNSTFSENLNLSASGRYSAFWNKFNVSGNISLPYLKTDPDSKGGLFNYGLQRQSINGSVNFSITGFPITYSRNQSYSANREEIPRLRSLTQNVSVSPRIPTFLGINPSINMKGNYNQNFTYIEADTGTIKKKAVTTTLNTSLGMRINNKNWWWIFHWFDGLSLSGGINLGVNYNNLPEYNTGIKEIFNDFYIDKYRFWENPSGLRADTAPESNVEIYKQNSKKSWNARLSTNFKFYDPIRTSASYGFTNSWSQSGASRSSYSDKHNVTASLNTDLNKIITLLDKILNKTMINGNYTWSNSIQATSKTNSISNSASGVLSLGWTKTLQTSFNISWSDNRSYTEGDIITKNNNGSISTGFNKRLQRDFVFKIPFIDKIIKLKNGLNLSMSISANYNQSFTNKIMDDPATYTQTVSLNGSFNYNMNPNLIISGGGSTEYFRNVKTPTDDTIRYQINAKVDLKF